MQRTCSVLLATMLFLAVVIPARAATFSAADVPSLISAINSANSNSEADTINLTGSIYELSAIDNSSFGPSGLPIISAGGGQLTINGNGAILRRSTVDGTPLFRILYLSGANVVINEISLTNGNVGGSGGGIGNSGTLVLNRVSMNNNTGVDGGALYNSGTATLNSCRLISNTGFVGGGVNNEGTITINGSTLSGNRADSNGGGLTSTNATSTLIGCTVSSNTAASYGGGIVNLSSSLTLTNTTISGNIAEDAGGGAIDTFGDGAAVVIDSCTITGNSAPNAAGGVRGGIWVELGTLSLTNSIVAGNSTQDFRHDGGTVTNGGYNLIGRNTSVATIFPAGLPAGTNYTGNTAFPLDPLLGPLQNNGGATYTHQLLTGSQALNHGSTTALSDQRAIPRPQGASDDIGALESLGALENGKLVVSITADEADSNYAADDISLREALMYANAFPDLSTITFNLPSGPQTINLTSALDSIGADVIILGPAAGVTVRRDTGGLYRIFAVDSGKGATLQNLTITNGNLAALGGGIYNQGNLALTNCVVSGNTGIGGGITSAVGSSLSLTNCVVSGNTSTGFGGGLLANGTTSVSNSAITGNTATTGGGIYTIGSLFLSHSTLSGNTATSIGGGIANNGGSANLFNSTISGNTASGGAEITDGGGGIVCYNSAATIQLTFCTVTANTAPNAGSGSRGGIWLQNGTLLVENSIVAGNGSGGSTRDILKTSGTVSNGGYNVIGDNTTVSTEFTSGGNSYVGTSGTPLNPQLGPLASNGGPTQTHALLVNSPARDHGSNAGAPTTDQRGTVRPQNTTVDIGAFELTASVSISGTVRTATSTPVSGVTVRLYVGANPVGAAVTTDANGNYTLTGVGFGTYAVTPTRTGYGFNPATRTVTVNDPNTNFTGQNFTASNHTISGRVAFSSGVGIANVLINLNNGRSTLTNGAGYFTLAGVLNGAYTVTPVLAGYSFNPTYLPAVITNANVANINFIGGYAINGRVANSSGIGLVGMRVYRTGSATPAVTNGAGYYAFYGVVNGAYTLTPDATQGYGYTPQTRSITVAGGSVNNQNFAGVTGFSIAGRVANSSGVGIAGVTVTRSGSALTVTTNGAGYYTFNGVANGTYTVTPSLSGSTFTPASRSVTVAGANVGSQNFVGSGP